VKKAIIKFLHHHLVKNGIVVQGATKKQKIVNLIEKLYPYKTQFELIRLGPNGDGGYLVPNHLDGIEACFSPGVDKISDFELDCLGYGMKVFMADKSVEKPNIDISEDRYDFIQKFVGCTNNEDFITMDKWVKSNCLSDSSELILQMDIEGGEFNSIINMSDSLMQRFRIMVIEFHNLQDMWNPHVFNLAETVFDKILQTHICVHIHPNNCCDIDSRFGINIPRATEITFLRKDDAEKKGLENAFPHKLDYDNTKNQHISLPKNWYKSI